MDIKRKTELIYIDRAIRSGEKARYQLVQVKNSLKSARNWGLFDIVKGKMITTFIKQTRINKAKRLLADADHSLRMFDLELGRLSTDTDISINVSLPTIVLDYFFDNPLVDLFVQAKILGGIRRVDRVIRQIDGVISQLEKQKSSLQ